MKARTVGKLDKRLNNTKKSYIIKKVQALNYNEEERKVVI